MSDCIDRQMLINLLTSRAETLRGLYGDLGGAASGVRKLVQTLPSVEPERKKGKWEIARKQTRDPLLARCSECKHYEGVEWIVLDHPSFCPNCGAEMRGEHE